MDAVLQNRVVWHLAVLLVLSCFHPSCSPAQVTFEKTFGGSSDDAGGCVHQTLDGGYVVVGHTESFGAGSTDVYLVRVDPLGSAVWERTYGGDNDDMAYSVLQTWDGRFVFAGRVESFGAGFGAPYLVKADWQGDTLWTRMYGGPGGDGAHSLVQTSDGGYFIAGYTVAFGEGSYDFYAIKTNSIGDTLWTRTYGDSCRQLAWCADGTRDNGYVIVGETDCRGVMSRDVYLVRTDSSGDTLWTRTYGGAQNEVGWAVQQTSDDGYIVTGTTNSYGDASGDVYLIKTDSQGDTVWTKTYGGTGFDIGHSVRQTSDGGYVIAGYTSSYGAGSYDVFLVRTDPLGEALWTRTFGGADWDMSFSVQQTSDGGYAIAGFTESFGAGARDLYLIKTNEDGVVGAVDRVEERTTQNLVPVQNWPNPFHRSTVISYSLPTTAQVTLSIYDVSGRLVKTLLNETQKGGFHHVHWNREMNPSGVYFCRVDAGEFVKTRKMVVVE